MTAYLIKRGDDVVGYLTDEQLADRIDGEEVVVDGMYERETYTIEDVPNEDVF